MVADDADHKRCAPLLQPRPERRVVPAPVLVELDHLLTRELGTDAFPKLLDTIKSGELDVEDLTASDYERVAGLILTYADLEVGFVDCASSPSQSASASPSSPPSTTAISPRCAPAILRPWTYFPPSRS